MSLDICCGPGVNITAISLSMGCEIEEVLERQCGFPIPEWASGYDMDDAHERNSFLDELLYAYAFEHLPGKYGCDKLFSYRAFPNGDCFVYADARRAYDASASWKSIRDILATEFGADAKVEWVEYTSW